MCCVLCACLLHRSLPPTFKPTFWPLRTTHHASVLSLDCLLEYRYPTRPTDIHLENLENSSESPPWALYLYDSPVSPPDSHETHTFGFGAPGRLSALSSHWKGWEGGRGCRGRERRAACRAGTPSLSLHRPLLSPASAFALIDALALHLTTCARTCTQCHPHSATLPETSAAAPASKQRDVETERSSQALGREVLMCERSSHLTLK